MTDTRCEISGDCRRWQGNPRQYQIRAQQLFSEEKEQALLPWSWINTTCETDDCLNPEHMRVHSPVRIKYPARICVYCGEGCDGVDHLLPQPWTGSAARHLVAVVPACSPCNSRINDFPDPNVATRRKRAQLSHERNGKDLLLRPIKTEEEIAELGYAMQTVARANNAKTERLMARLAWPSDPYFDLRAFQKSGIDDPISLGLCDELSTPLRSDFKMLERTDA